MNERVDALVARFEAANADAIATVESLSDAEWAAITEEGWTVAACAHHIGIVHAGIASFVAEVANGTAAPRQGMDSIDTSNAEHAAAFAACPKPEALEALRAGGAAAAAKLRALRDADLDRTTDAIPGGATVTAAQIGEMALLGHLTSHLASIKAATGR